MKYTSSVMSVSSLYKGGILRTREQSGKGGRLLCCPLSPYLCFFLLHFLSSSFLPAGAPVCTGERAREPHACHAALAVAAVRLEPPRNVSASEKTAINRILVKSGIIRDSLVRYARLSRASTKN